MYFRKFFPKKYASCTSAIPNEACNSMSQKFNQNLNRVNVSRIS